VRFRAWHGAGAAYRPKIILRRTIFAHRRLGEQLGLERLGLRGTAKKAFWLPKGIFGVSRRRFAHLRKFLARMNYC
jgi:hypothetical protein